MKHVKVRAEFHPSSKRVKVSILSQTHVGAAFGPIPVRSGSSRFKHDGFILGSSKGPGWYSKSGALYLWGDSKVFNDSHIWLTPKEWKQAREAILAYNEWGRTQ